MPKTGQMQELSTFRRFTDREQALDLVELLNDHKISNELEESASALDTSFGGGPSTQVFEVKLWESDFAKANALMEETAKESVASVSP